MTDQILTSEEISKIENRLVEFINFPMFTPSVRAEIAKDAISAEMERPDIDEIKRQKCTVILNKLASLKKESETK